MPSPRNLSKITAPTLQRVFGNERLFARLDAARFYPIVWIHGPPGAGKTTLAASYLAEKGIEPLWCRFDEGDSDPASVFMHLAAAAKLSAPAVDLPLLQPEFRTALPLFTRRFFRGLFAADGVSIVVLDDYQEVAAGAELHDCLPAGLEEVPSGCQVIIISRSAPPSQLARLRLNGRIDVIEPDALRLNMKEIRHLARERGADARNFAEEQIVEATQGWAAGVILMLEAATTDPAAMHAGTARLPEVLFDYFAGEVLRRMEPWAPTVLSTLALMPTMTAATAERLTGRPEAGALLEDLNRRNYFTARDGAPEPRYRFHPLFRDFLLATTRRQSDSRDTTLLKIHAATVLDGDGQPDAAVDLLAETGQTDALSALVKRRAAALIEEGRNDTLVAWLSRLGDARIAGDPWLSYWRGTARVSFDPIDAYPHFMTALALFEAAADTTGQFVAWAGAAEAVRLDPFGDMTRFDPLVARMHRLLVRQPTFPSPGLELSVSAGMVSALSRRGADSTEFEAWKVRARAAADVIGQPALSIRIGLAFAIMDLMNGNFTAVQDALDTFPDPMTLDHMPLAQWAGLVFHALTLNHFQKQGDCGIFTNEALKRLDQSGIILWKPMLAANAGVDAYNKNDRRRCEEWRLRTLAYAREARIAQGPLYYAAAAGQKLVDGDAAGALKEAERALESARRCGWRYFIVQAHLLRALCHFAADELDKMASALDAANDELARSLSGSLAFTSKLLSSDFHYARGDESAGRFSLAAAMALGRAQGARSAPFVADTDMARHCKRALDLNIEPEFVRTQIFCLKLSCPDPHDSAWPWPIRIATLGGFSIEIDGVPIAFAGKTPRRLISLIKAIAAYGGVAVPEGKLIDAIWPDEDGDAARSALTIAIHRVRKLFGDASCIIVKDGTVGLDRSRAWLDIWAVERKLASRSSNESQQAYETRCCEGLALYRGEFLPEDEDQWWTAERRDALCKSYQRALLRA